VFARSRELSETIVNPYSPGSLIGVLGIYRYM
jgi:hypothetical protein